jgi:hypothetical protein
MKRNEMADVGDGVGFGRFVASERPKKKIQSSRCKVNGTNSNHAGSSGSAKCEVHAAGGASVEMVICYAASRQPGASKVPRVGMVVAK